MDDNRLSKSLEQEFVNGDPQYNFGGWVPPVIFDTPISNPLWVAGGQGTNTLAYSTDGITWSASTNGNSIFTGLVAGLAWNGSLWVAGGQGTNTLAYSYDGITWSGSTNGNSIISASARGIAWNGSLFVADACKADVHTIQHSIHSRILTIQLLLDVAFQFHNLG
jgi:hypothetical protein